jgi:hypothetical protein
MEYRKPTSARRRRWLKWLSWLVIIIVAGFLLREPLQRGIIAVTIRNEHIFHEPADLAAESWWKRNGEATGFYWDVSKLRVAREARLREFNPELQTLVGAIGRRQAHGEGMQYSMHIYREIRWLLNFTPDTSAIRSRINALRSSLTDSAGQRSATQQLPGDGSWGYGMNAWYLRLYYSVEDGVDTLTVQPRYRLAILDRINSPVRLHAVLDSDLFDHFTQTGIFNREELDETFSAMARLLHKKNKIIYPFDPGLDSTLRSFVQGWQNPESGCWGQWMVDREGKVWKMDDMAMTFHVVSDFKGEVDHLDLIARRVLQLDKVNFPTGIRFDGSYSNHLNWDVVKIFRYAWPCMDSATRAAARKEISTMLDWCLKKSYQPDGSFETSELDETVGDAYIYGVSFLKDAGYFSVKNRFWTNEDFPNAQTIRERITGKIKSIGLNDPQLRDAYKILTESNYGY